MNDRDARDPQHDHRAVRALEDVVAVDHMAPGMVRVTTWSDSYVVDARDAGCNCPDSKYNLEDGDICKHHMAAMIASSDKYPTPYTTTTTEQHA